jgi:hypothetical protein
VVLSWGDGCDGGGGGGALRNGLVAMCERFELDLRGVGGDLGGIEDVRHFGVGSIGRVGVLIAAMMAERPTGISIGCLNVDVVGFVQGM